MANEPYNLFRQETAQNSKWGGAPKLRPKSGDFALVDIHGDYAWTASPRGVARAEIPVIEFDELELDLSSLITSALYKLRGGIENLAALGNNIDEVKDKILGTAKSLNINTQTLENTVTSDPLNPYAGMYAASPTGWRYVAPYLEGLNQQISNSWGDDTSNVLNSSLGSALKDIGTQAENYLNMTNLANIAAPGSYAEKVKFFNPGDSDSYTIRFPLLNTLEFDDIVKNWELCYLLTYQNLPNRRSVNLLDPPSIYRVTIPGVRQSPAAYIANLSIMHVGAIRNMLIHGKIKPIPEAYLISITFKDLINNSRNLFKYALDNQQVVATTEVAGLGSALVNGR